MVLNPKRMPDEFLQNRSHANGACKYNNTHAEFSGLNCLFPFLF